MHTSLLVKMYKTLKSRKILDFRDTGNAKHFQVNQRFFVNLETSKKFPVSQKNRRFFSGFRKFVKFSRKSQIHMMETIAVLAIFFILVAIGLIFYSSVVTRNVAIEKEGNNQLNAVRIVQMASFLPELQCSQENIIIDNCIDILNLESMPEVINENQIYYFDLHHVYFFYNRHPDSIYRDYHTIHEQQIIPQDYMLGLSKSQHLT